MRFGTKAAIMGAFAGPAIAALMLTGAGPANAATTTATAHTAATWVNQGCNPRHLERWDFRGDNTVDYSFTNGKGPTDQTYAVHFEQRGSCLSGTLTDNNIPYSVKTGPIYGTVVRNEVTFSYTYTYPGSNQGTRIFTGYVDRWGNVSGTWTETGTEGGIGTWSLAHAVRPACPQWGFWWGFWQYGAGCPVPFPYWWYY
jgi:hypothetical protein